MRLVSAYFLQLALSRLQGADVQEGQGYGFGVLGLLIPAQGQMLCMLEAR